jgi:hypothetical protein
MKQSIMGTLIIACGVALILFSLGEILLRIAVTLFGLYIINYGFKIRGEGSLYTKAYRWYTCRPF